MNKKPSVFEQGVQYTYNPIFETFLAKLEKVGFKVHPATREESDKVLSWGASHMASSLPVHEILLGVERGPKIKLPCIASEAVYTWCGMVFFDHKLGVKSDEWADTKSIWAGLSSAESCLGKYE